MKNKFVIINLVIMLLFFWGCKQEKESANGRETYPIKIDSISKKEFKIGDTIVIYGYGFGSERGNNYLLFETTSAEEENYLNWSDTLITVIVPEGVSSGNVHLNSKLSNSLEFKVKRHFFIEVIDFLIKISLAITIIYIYLRINKIWKRKHELDVAESQSLAGLTIYILNCVLWVSYYIFVEPDTKSMLDTSVYIFEGIIFFIIGTGIFVRGQTKTNLWFLIKRALKIESKEADYLLKRLFKFQNAEEIIMILHQLAMIDNELSPKEQALLESFAKEWRIDYSPEKYNKGRTEDKEINYIKLRNSVIKYLDLDPPKEQAAQLIDMIEVLIKADEKVTSEEELIHAELKGIIDNYLNQEKQNPLYHVIIVPQKPEHELIIKDTFPDAIRLTISGGVAYSVGSYYSHKYAEMICQERRKIKMFTIVYTPEPDSLETNFN